MKAKDTKKIISGIESGYDLVAEKFSGTRAYMWRDLEFVKNMVKPGDRVLDFGCGNGRLAGFLGGEYKHYVGVDISKNLIDIAKQRYHSENISFVKLSSDFSSLPFKDNQFDIIFSIAVFHHFPSGKYTSEVFSELHRVLKPDGKIVIAVWNLWRKQYLKYHKKEKDEWIDAAIPFRSNEKTFQRYHHPFTVRELKIFFGGSGFKIISCKKHFNLVCKLYEGKKAIRYFRKFSVAYCRLHPSRKKAQKALFTAKTADEFLAAVEQWYSED